MTTRSTGSQVHPLISSEFNIAGYSLITQPNVVREIVLHKNVASAYADLVPVARPVPVDLATLLGSLLSASGRQNLTLTLEDGKFVQLAKATASGSADAGDSTDIPAPLQARKDGLCRHGCVSGNSPLICREAVAWLIGCHRDTLSRRREELEAAGLVGKRLSGSSIRWRRDDVLSFAARKGVGKRAVGRPRKRP